MKKSRIKIHPTTLLLVPIFILLKSGFLFFIYIVCLVLHELAHSLVSSSRGYSLGRIHIFPYGASIEGSSQNITEVDEIIIALSGPLFNICVAIVFVALWWIYPFTYYYTDMIVYANLSIAAFNLLPIFPLDGGRIILALFSLHFPRKKVLLVIRRISFAISALLFLACVGLTAAVLFGLGIQGANLNSHLLSSITLTFTCLFLFAGVSSTSDTDNYMRNLGKSSKLRRLENGLEQTNLLVHCSLQLRQVLRKIKPTCYYNIIIVDSNFNVLSTITEDTLEQLLLKYGFKKTLYSAVVNQT